MDKLSSSCWSVCLLVLLLFRVVNIDAISSCRETPYPEICESYASTNLPETPEDFRIQFRNMALQVTLNQAEQAHKLVSTMDTSSLDDRAKVAWADCLELSEDTIIQLNRSMKTSNPTSIQDAQTWLSAAINNQQTCQNGFFELNSSSHLLSFPTFNNISKLIGNSLAINRASLPSTNDGKGRRRLLSNKFPAWFSIADRKLLQSSSIKADIVVAQDGSGNYETITEALAASEKLESGTNRFVIHVKAGVYEENIEIKHSMENLMFIGDGIDATIVTGNRNVQDGSTTFSSATFAVSGDGFVARDMTFENTAGPQKGQAVALRSSSDQSVFYSCSHGRSHMVVIWGKCPM